MNMLYDELKTWWELPALLLSLSLPVSLFLLLEILRHGWKELKRGTCDTISWFWLIVMIHMMITNKHGFLGRCLSLCARDTISGLWLFDWWHLSSEEAFNYFVNKFQDRALLFPCRANYDCRRTIYGGFSFIFIIEKLSLHGTWQYFFSSDWQWSDDTHHENKKGQSDRQVQKGNRSVVQVRCGARACALIADLSNKKIERDASIWLKQVLFG